MKKKQKKADGLRNRRGKWYARVYFTIDGNKKEKEVPLRTSSKVVARERRIEVMRKAEDIKNNIDFTFPWIDDSVTTTKVKRFTLEDAINQWMNKRKKYRKTTLTINWQGLNYLTDCLGNSHPLESITNSHIDRFVEYMESKGLSDTSVNIHLRTIKTMFRYWLKRERINKIPIIEQTPVKKTEPIYITDQEFHSIMNIDWLDNSYKRVFLLYRETGMRLREPMMSVIDGAWIDIPNESKGGASRNIELDESLQAIFIEYKKWLDSGYGSTLVDVGDHISKVFKKCLREIGADESKHFHSLRHTFAVRKLLMSVPIHEVKLLMGHSSVTTTEQYSNMNLKRVAQDFPGLVRPSDPMPKLAMEDMVLEGMEGEPSDYLIKYEKIEA